MNNLIVLIDCYQQDILSLLRMQSSTMIILVESKIFQYANLLTRQTPNENEIKIDEEEIVKLSQFLHINTKIIINCTDQSICLRQKIEILLGVKQQFNNPQIASFNKYDILHCLFESGLLLNKPQMIHNTEDYNRLKPESNHICKPTWGGGSIGITFNQAPKSFPAILINFFTGDEYALDFFTSDGVHHLCSVWKYIRKLPNDIKKDRIDWVRDIHSPEVILMQDYCKKALDIVGLKNGLAHVEVKINEKNQIEMMEINFRFQGHTPYSTLSQMGLSNQFDALINQQFGSSAGTQDTYLTRFILQTKNSHQFKIPWDQIKNLTSFKEIHLNYSEKVQFFLKTNDSRSYIAYITIASNNKTDFENDLTALSSVQMYL